MFATGAQFWQNGLQMLGDARVLAVEQRHLAAVLYAQRRRQRVRVREGHVVDRPVQHDLHANELRTQRTVPATRAKWQRTEFGLALASYIPKGHVKVQVKVPLGNFFETLNLGRNR